MQDKKSKPSRKISRRIATIRTNPNSNNDSKNPLPINSSETISIAEPHPDKNIILKGRSIRFVDLEEEILSKTKSDSPLSLSSSLSLDSNEHNLVNRKKKTQDSSAFSSIDSLLNMRPASKGDAFRKKIEDMRNEAGTTWLKVFKEVQNQNLPPSKKKSIISPISKDLELDVPKFEYLQSNETLAESTSLPSSSSSTPKDSSSQILTSCEPLQEKPEEIDEVVPESLSESLPEGPRFEILVDEISYRSTPERLLHTSTASKVLWVLTQNEFIEFDKTSFKILSKKAFSSLMKAVLPSKPRRVRLEFKSSRYDSPSFYDITFENQIGFKQFLSHIKPILKRNINDGLFHDRYKQAKCLTCNWQGFLMDKTSFLTQQNITPIELDSDGAIFLNKHLNFQVFSFLEEVPNKEYKDSLSCEKCSGTFLVEFYGREKANGTGLLPSLVKFPFQATKLVTSYIGTPLTSHMGSFLKPGITSTTNKDPSSGEINLSLDLSPSVNGLDWFDTLPGFQPSLLPFQTLTNTLRLHIDLKVLEEEGETLASWVPSTVLLQAPPVFTVPSKWSLRAYVAHAELLPSPPTEEPLYILLSNQRLYLFGLGLFNSDDPESVLVLQHRISFSSIARIDVGCNRQSLTFHFRLSDKDPKTGQYLSKPAAIDLPNSSITVLIRDKRTCSSFLDSLLEILYELGVKIVNHNVLWAVHNLRNQVFLKPSEKSYCVNGQVIPGSRLPRDPATGEDVVVDKVTFDFLKFVGQVGFFCEGYLKSVALIVTDTFLYLCYERYDVWPPAISELSELSSHEEKKTFSNRLTCFAVPQYTPIEALAISDILATHRQSIAISCRFGPSSPDLTSPAVSFKVALNISGVPNLISPSLVPLPLSRPVSPLIDNSPVSLEDTSKLNSEATSPQGTSWNLLFTTEASCQELQEVLDSLKPSI